MQNFRADNQDRQKIIIGKIGVMTCNVIAEAVRQILIAICKLAKTAT